MKKVSGFLYQVFGMYCGKEEALSMAADKKEAEEDLKRNLEEARENKEQK